MGGALGSNNLLMSSSAVGHTQADFEDSSIPQNVDISQDEGRSGLDRDRPLVSRKYFQTLARQPVLCFERLVGIAHSAYPDPILLLLGDFSLQEIRRIHLHVDKLPPGFLVPGESLHETSVAIRTTMLTARVGIDDVGIDFRYGENRLGSGFVDDHASIIGAPEREGPAGSTRGQAAMTRLIMP
jgi:hypothetical protein